MTGSLEHSYLVLGIYPSENRRLVKDAISQGIASGGLRREQVPVLVSIDHHSEVPSVFAPSKSAEAEIDRMLASGACLRCLWIGESPTPYIARALEKNISIATAASEWMRQTQMLLHLACRYRAWSSTLVLEEIHSNPAGFVSEFVSSPASDTFNK